MNERDDRPASRESDLRSAGKVAAAAWTLALLTKQARGARAELMRVRRELAETRLKFSGTQAVQLRDANEKLVVGALRAETIADSATSELSELTYTSQRDPLTNTPNRALMLDRLESAIALSRRHATRMAVLFVDLDDFKEINDSLGHAAGDEVVKLVARRLESTVRGSDTVSRHGGDEFLVLLAEVADEASAAQVAIKIIAALGAPSVQGEHVLRLSASVGVAVYPEDGERAEALIKRSDAAMYRAKKLGRGRFALHAQSRSKRPHTSATTDGIPPKPPSDGVDPAAHGAHLRHLREANEQLIIAALAAQELRQQSQKEQHRQMELLAVAAHELRTPARVRTVADLINHSSTDEALSEEVQIVIKSQVAYMAKLVDDLLDGARGRMGMFRLERALVDVVDIVRDAARTCGPAVATRRQSFEMRLPLQPLHVHGDSVRLRQIFSNLLDNASKFTGEGGAITLGMTADEKSLTVTVSDNGIGIAPEVLPNIFDLFVQEADGGSLRNGGLGVGLAIVRDLVEAHGGSVIGGSAGHYCGSQFAVTLPLAGVPSPRSPEPRLPRTQLRP